MKTPYVGITGPVTVDEVRQVGQAFRDAGFTKNSSHVPMIGILVSHKTLQGQPTQNRRYPKYEDVPALVEAADEFGIPMIHYNSREKGTLLSQLEKILEKSRMCQGIQLNIPWPDIETIKKTRETSKYVDFVIQLSGGAMKDLSPEQIAREVGKYGILANYTLIDPSGGKAKEFDIESSLTIYQELNVHAPNTRVGFAGGFTGDNVRVRVKKLRERLGTKVFCIDAEGGLRDKLSEEPADDILNMDKVKNYLEQAALGLY